MNKYEGHLKDNRGKTNHLNGFNTIYKEKELADD